MLETVQWTILYQFLVIQLVFHSKTVHIGIKFTTKEGDNGGVVLTVTYLSKVVCGFVVVIYLGGSNLNGLYNDGLLK